MEIQVRWGNGVFRPLTPLHLKSAVVTIQVPNDEVTTGSETDYTLSSQARAIAEAMTADIYKILDGPLPLDETLADPDTGELERMSAFSLREDR